MNKEKSLKIGLIGPLPDPINGCSLANVTFLKYLLSKQYQVKSINTSVDIEIQGIQGQFSWLKFFNFLNVYFQLSKIFRIDILYITPGQSFWGILKYSPFIILALILRKPYVLHIHGNYLGTQYRLLNGLKKKIFKFLISQASAGIVLSNSLRSNFDELLASDRIFVVENFVTNELISEKKILKSNKSLEILWLSNLMEEKGILNFLDALIILKEKGVNFNAKIAGKIEDGLDSIIYQKLNELGDLAEYVDIVKGKQKKDLLEKANLFVFPTFYTMEGQPISLIEAMATGNIIITTQHAGIPDIVSSANGYLIQPQNIQALADQIEHVSKNLSNEIEKFSLVNQIYAKEKFTEQVFGQKILNVIMQVCSK